MSPWDVNPGYLGREDLLAEHRELRALLARGRPESEALAALDRHRDLVVAELRLRGIEVPAAAGVEGATGVETATRTATDDPPAATPAAQLRQLRVRYRGGERGDEGGAGRIPLPERLHELWAQHKYSALARDPERYRDLGQRVASHRARGLPDDIVDEIVGLLRSPPPEGRLRNALQHLWSHVKEVAEAPDRDAAPLRAREDPAGFLECIARLAREHRVEYLLHSTALSDLAIWCQPRRDP